MDRKLKMVQHLIEAHKLARKSDDEMLVYLIEMAILETCCLTNLELEENESTFEVKVRY